MAVMYAELCVMYDLKRNEDCRACLGSLCSSKQVHHGHGWGCEARYALHHCISKRAYQDERNVKCACVILQARKNCSTDTGRKQAKGLVGQSGLNA